MDGRIKAHPVDRRLGDYVSHSDPRDQVQELERLIRLTLERAEEGQDPTLTDRLIAVLKEYARAPEICRWDTPIHQVVANKRDRSLMKAVGVVYAGEFYAIAGRLGRYETQIERIRADLLEAGLGPSEDLQRWRPDYWSNPTFKQELSVLLISRCPTRRVRHWRLELLEHGSRYADKLLHRGVARTAHTKGVHALGECLRSSPTTERALRELRQAQKVFEAADSLLWAGAILPADWKAPLWKEAWASELKELEKERGEIAAAVKEQAGLLDDPGKQANYLKRVLRELDLHTILDAPGALLDFSVRVQGHFETIGTLRELVHPEVAELLRYLPESEQMEVRNGLAQHGLRIGMSEVEIAEWERTHPGD